MKQLIKSFQKIGINLSPAGHWKFDEEGKKVAINAYRQDGLKWQGYEDDNMAKYRPEQSGHYVLDIDDMRTAKKLLPTDIWEKSMQTFRYNTTDVNKMHCVFKRIGEKEFPRLVWSNGAIDSLSRGISFTGHLISEPDSKFKLYSDKVLTISDEEIEIINQIIYENISEDEKKRSVDAWKKVVLPDNYFIPSLGLSLREVANGEAVVGQRCDCPFNEPHSNNDGGKGYGFVTGNLGVGCNSCHKIAIAENLYGFNVNEGIKVQKQTSMRERINAIKLTKEKAADIMHTQMLIPSLIARGHHAYIFGAAGSGKTTLMAALAVQMAEKHNVYVDFWSFDASPSHNAAIERLSRFRGVSELVAVIAGATITDLKEHYRQAIRDKEDMNNLVIVLDTFKFLSDDVNNKKANRDAMHFIKSIQKLGATFVSLGHTNKDGKNQSGTAEIEQDCDAIFRIDRMDEGDNIVATISKGGRVRYETKDLTYRMIPDDNDFWFSSMNTVQLLDEVIDINKRIAQAEMLENDRDEVEFILEVIRGQNKPTQSDIVDKLKGEMSRNIVLKYLKKYHGILWKKSYDKKNNNSTRYSIVPHNVDNYG